MAQLTMNLDDELSKIESRRVELRILWKDPGGPNAVEDDHRRSQIEFWRTDLLVKWKLLEDIQLENDAASIVITQLTQDEVTRAEQAMNDLNKQIQKDQVWDNVINVVTTVLNAASTTVRTAAKK